MEQYNGWNIFSMEDMIGRHNMMSCTIGSSMMSCTVTEDDMKLAFAPAVKLSELTPFSCPCCGGNSYTNENGDIKCDYCGTMFPFHFDLAQKPDTTVTQMVMPKPLGNDTSH